MEDRETPQIHKYGESKTTQIMMATAHHVTAWVWRTKYQAAWFLLNRVYYMTAFRQRQSTCRSPNVSSLCNCNQPYC